MTNAMNCFCLIVTGGIPFQMPMNPNMVMPLPSACNIPGVPLKCKGTIQLLVDSNLQDLTYVNEVEVVIKYLLIVNQKFQIRVLLNKESFTS